MKITIKTLGSTSLPLYRKVSPKLDYRFPIPKQVTSLSKTVALFRSWQIIHKDSCVTIARVCLKDLICAVVVFVKGLV